jgi:hypothetical protein
MSGGHSQARVQSAPAAVHEALLGTPWQGLGQLIDSYIALVHAAYVMVPVTNSGASPSPEQSKNHEPLKLPSSVA